MIASRLHTHRSGSIRLVLIVLLFILSAMTVGAALAHVAMQIVPVAAPVAGPSACVVSAPRMAPAAAPALPILAIKPQPIADSQPVIDRPKPIRVRYAKSVHGRVRGRFAARD